MKTINPPKSINRGVGFCRMDDLKHTISHLKRPTNYGKKLHKTNAAKQENQLRYCGNYLKKTSHQNHKKIRRAFPQLYRPSSLAFSITRTLNCGTRHTKSSTCPEVDRRTKQLPSSPSCQNEAVKAQRPSGSTPGFWGLFHYFIAEKCVAVVRRT